MVFGGLDSGAANPARSDGTTLLDETWAGAPFRGKGALVAQVRDVVAAWVTQGLLGPEESATVVRGARKASYEE